MLDWEKVIMFTNQPENLKNDLDKLVESLVCCSGKCSDQCPMRSAEWKEHDIAFCQEFSEDRIFVPRQLVHRAISALIAFKTQTPNVMTLDELRLIGNRNPEHIWPLGTPPYLWMEINPYFRRSNGFWVAWRDVWEMLTNVNPTFVADNYDKLWRCFAIKPTENQIKDLKWKRPVKKK